MSLKKKAAIVGVGLAGTAAVGYGAGQAVLESAAATNAAALAPVTTAATTLNHANLALQANTLNYTVMNSATPHLASAVTSAKTALVTAKATAAAHTVTPLAAGAHAAGAALYSGAGTIIGGAVHLAAAGASVAAPYVVGAASFIFTHGAGIAIAIGAAGMAPLFGAVAVAGACYLAWKGAQALGHCLKKLFHHDKPAPSEQFGQPDPEHTFQDNVIKHGPPKTVTPAQEQSMQRALDDPKRSKEEVAAMQRAMNQVDQMHQNGASSTGNHLPQGNQREFAGQGRS